MATVINLSDSRTGQPAPPLPRRSAPAHVYDLVERRCASDSAARIAQDLVQRAERLGLLDGQTVQVCWEDPELPGERRYAVGFQYGHTETELLLAFYTSGPDRLGPTLQIPVAGVKTVLQLSPEAVCF